MTDKTQDLANRVGAAMRDVEARIAAGNMAGAAGAATALHGLLGEVYLTVNELRDEIGDPPLDWNAIVGPRTQSGGGPKTPPKPS